MRDGKLTRDEAKKILAGEFRHEKPKGEMKELFNYIGKSEIPTRIKAEIYNKVVSKWK